MDKWEKVINTIPELNRSGCHGEMLPHDWLPKCAVDDDCDQWGNNGTRAGWVKGLHKCHRMKAGHRANSQRRPH